jgi:DNA-binding HxlR family transcriptional regulator
MARQPVTSVCPRYHHAVELIGRRWNGAIVRILLSRAHRFAEIAAAIPDISDRMLAERLKELEQEGLVVRAVIPDSPVRVEYALTERGRALEPAIRALGEWAEEWLPIEEPESSASPEARPRKT